MQVEDTSEREYEYFECHYVSRMGCFLRKCLHRAGMSDRRTRRFACASAAPLTHADAGAAQGMLCGVHLQVLVSGFVHFRISSVLVGTSTVSVRLIVCMCVRVKAGMSVSMDIKQSRGEWNSKLGYI